MSGLVSISWITLPCYILLCGRWAAPSGIPVGASRVRWKSLEKPRKTQVALLTLTLAYQIRGFLLLILSHHRMSSTSLLTLRQVHPIVKRRW